MYVRYGILILSLFLKLDDGFSTRNVMEIDSRFFRSFLRDEMFFQIQFFYLFLLLKPDINILVTNTCFNPFYTK